MGKLMNHLKKQLKTENKKDAEECILIYNKLRELDKDGCVWSSRWSPLVDVRFEGWNTKIYKPNSLGKIFVKDIKS